MPPGQHQASSTYLRSLSCRTACPYWHLCCCHLRGPQGLAPFHAPRVFGDQVAHAAFRGGRIGLAIVEGMHTRASAARVKGTMNMAALAILRDDFYSLRAVVTVPLKACIERIRLTGGQA